MADSDLPRDPLAAHEVVMQRAEAVLERRNEERRKPLPEQTQAEVCFVRHQGSQSIQAEVLEVSTTGMRLAAFANDSIHQGDRCEIAVQGQDPVVRRWATVRWIKPHPLIQVFGVQFDASAS